VAMLAGRLVTDLARLDHVLALLGSVLHAADDRGFPVTPLFSYMEIVSTFASDLSCFKIFIKMLSINFINISK